MKLLISLFLMLSFYSSVSGQKQEDKTKQKINLICDPSVEDMMLYIIDGVYTIKEDEKMVASNIDKSSILFIGLLLPGDSDFEKEVAKTSYPDKIRKIITLHLKEGTSYPFETKE